MTTTAMFLFLQDQYAVIAAVLLLSVVFLLVEGRFQEGRRGRALTVAMLIAAPLCLVAVGYALS